MKQNATVANAIRSRHDLRALPELTAEFNMNRYVTPTVGNIVSEDVSGNDIEMYPLESIVEPLRPIKGINKARINYGTIADDYQNPTTPRFYVSSMDDSYKYWMSPNVSDGAGNITGCEPRVIYSETIQTNKIVIGIENSWATPTDYNIQTTTNGGSSWQVVGNAPVANDGRITLWWNGTSWQNTQPADTTATTSINGIKFHCWKLGGGKKIDGSAVQARWWDGSMATTNGTGSYLSLIEISARLFVDLSDKVISVSDIFDGGEASHLTPIGTVTTNTASVDLWDVYEGDPDPVWSKYLEPNVEMNLRYIYNVDGVEYPIQQFKMYTDNWSENDDSTFTVQLSDASKYLKEVKPRPGKYEKLTMSQIMYRLMDGAGFTDYNIFDNPLTVDYRIPVFWVDGEKTVWEIFDELAIATQSLVYFDSNGKLNVKTREDAYWNGAAVDWNLRARASGTDLADIISLDKTDEYEANVVKVIYKTAQWSDEVNGFAEMSTVWSPEEDTLVRASPLIRSMDADDTILLVSSYEASVWPFEGMVQIEGELMRYKGKVFVYLDGNTWTWVTCNDLSEYQKYNERTPSGARWQNHFSGQFIITERGAWNTEATAHYVEANGYETKRWGKGLVYMGPSGFHHNREYSTVTLSHDGHLDSVMDGFMATRGATADTGWRHMGLRMKFSRYGGVDQRGGLVFNGKGNHDGYFVEVTPSVRLTDKDGDKRKEVSFYAINNNNGGTILKTAGVTIVDEKWFNLDVYYDWGSQRVAVWIDGKKVFQVYVEGGLQITPNGKIGMFIRGKTVADFEYLYGINRSDEPEFQTDFSIFNRLTGSEQSNSLTKEWVYKWRNRRRIKKKTVNQKHRFNQQLIDEFGPYVHEVREFDVKFDPAPVQHSKLYMSNTYTASLLEYRANAFGAKFAIANTGRTHAVLNGSDSTLGADAEVGQQMFVFGRALVIGEQEEIIERNELQIRARGEIVTEVSSDWIQSKSAAEALALWISEHWSKGADELSVEVFGNPLLEVGDLVAIDYPAKKMELGTHQYFVTSTSTSFDNGLSTSLVLRRKN